MRGGDERSGSLFSYVDLEARVGRDHPLRTIRSVVNEALAALSGEFSALYSQSGRPSIPPGRLFKSMLLIALYSVRSERQFCEQLDYNLLFRWFLDMDMTEESFVPTVFSHNRDRLIVHDGPPDPALIERASLVAVRVSSDGANRNPLLQKGVDDRAALLAGRADHGDRPIANSLASHVKRPAVP